MTGALYRVALLAVTVVATIAIAARGATRELEQSSDDIFREPMIIFVADGPPNSCGPGCNRWIAAEGLFDPGSAKRVISFLDEHRDLNLPIYFHSKGGFTEEAIKVGEHLRWLKIRAGVGRTALQRCIGTATSPDCSRHVEKTKDRLAQLRLSEGFCGSACVYAFIGASSRTVDARARIGVHASRPTKITITQKGLAAITSSKLSADESRRYSQHLFDLWHYVGRMAVDPRLVDLATKVDPRSIKILSRDELVRFGIVTTDRFETPWIGRDEAPSTGYTLFKKLSRRSPEDDGVYLTTTVGVTCYRRDRATVYIEREIPRGEAENVPIIRILADEKAAWTSTEGMSANPSVDFRAQTIPFDDVLNLVPKRSFELVLDYRTPEWAKRSTSIKLSIAGLDAALAKMRRRCEEFQ